MLNFAHWLTEHENQTLIYLDLDDTLINSNQKADGTTPKGETLYVHVRPGAEKFVNACKKLAPTYIITHSQTAPRRQIIKKLGWDIQVFGADNYQNAISSQKAILVDNRPPSEPYTKAKLKAIGLTDLKRVITSPTWKGDSQDHALADVLHKLKSIITTNEWTEKIPSPVKKQPFDDYDEAKEMAQARHRKFRELLKKAAGKAEVLVNIKSEDSFDDKVEKRGRRPEHVHDVLRAAILTTHKIEMYPVLQHIKEIFKVNKVEHKNDPTEEKLGYYGAIHIDVVVNGMVCEIQLMTKKFWDYKSKAHKYYVKYRSQDEPPKSIVKKCKTLHKLGNER